MNDEQRKTARRRRGRGEGAIYYRERDQQWVGSVSLGYDGQGKRKRKVVYGATKKEVQEKVGQLQHDAVNGRLADASRMTVADYLTRWLENAAKPRVQPKTHLRYEQLIRLRISPHIGGVRLGRLTPIHIEQLFACLERDGVSARGRQMAGTMLHTALRHAVRLRLIPFNPASEIAKPRPQKQGVQVFDVGQVKRFLDAAAADRLYALYVLAIDSGMRQGELFALQWADVDFETGCLVVQRSLEEVNGHLREKETKTARGRRRIDLSAFALSALNDHRKRMLAEGNASGPVFCDRSGGWLRKGNVLRRSFWPVMDRANDMAREEAAKHGRTPDLLPRIRFHDLRHTSATLLLLANENVKVVSERLGHASIQLTLDTYSHVLPTMQKAAAAKLDGIFGGRAPL
jgi:integrase